MARRPRLGWPFLPRPDDNGRMRFPNTLESSVRERMQIILSVRPREMMFHPEFGAGLDLLLHQPNTLKLRRDLVDRIEESLARWEPRIVVDRVDVEEVEYAPTQLRVNIAYRLRRTGRSQSLGLTLATGT